MSSQHRGIIPDAESRISGIFSYRPALDGIRAVAVLAVMAYHTQLIMPGGRWIVKGGFLGVDIFFVLSGFLITSVLLKEYGKQRWISLKNFYIRRLCRLTPAFWLFLVVLWLFGERLMPVDMARETFADHNLLFSFLYLLNWHIGFTGEMAGHLNLTWSLAIEEQFYLLWGGTLTLIVLRSRRPESVLARSLPVVIVLIVIWRAARAYANVSTIMLYYATDTRIDGLLIGCLASVIYCGRMIGAEVYRSRWFTSLFIMTTLAAIAIGCAFSYRDRSFYYGIGTVFCLAVAIAILWILNNEGTYLHRVLEHPVAVWIGSISYGVYLWHYLAFEVANQIPTMGGVRLFAGIGLALVTASCSYYLIERPFLRLKNRYAGA